MLTLNTKTSSIEVFFQGGFVEQTLYIIKPEGFAHRDEIRTLVLDEGLVIARSAEVVLTALDVQTLYPEALRVGEAVLRMVEHYMTAGPCEVAIVEGENAIARLHVLKGTWTNPNHCDEGTIRKRFGTTDGSWANSVPYFLNAFHCPKNAIEAKADLLWAQTFF